MTDTDDDADDRAPDTDDATDDGAAQTPQVDPQAALAAQLTAERMARARAERRAATAEGLMQRMGRGQAAPLTPQDVERLIEGRVAQRLAAHAFNARSNAVHAAGTQAFPDFEDRMAALRQAGVLHPDDPRLLGAVLQTEAPEKVLHHLGGDPQAAAQLAGLPPVPQAAALARIGLKVGQPDYKPVSRAPAPIRPIGGPATKAFNPLDEDTPMDEWVREMDKRDRARR